MLRWRRRLLVIAAVVAVAALIAFIANRKLRNDRPAQQKPAAVNVPKKRGAIDPQTGVPDWLGQRGIAAQRIAGVVIDERGGLIRGATVRLSAMHTNARLVKEPTAVTDESGRFDFGPQPALTYIVGAEMRPFTPVLLRVELRDPTWQPRPDQVRLVMHPCNASIHGSILDAAGGTIPHAVIARGEGSLDMSGGAEADDNGAYELCIPIGGGAVRVSADGYAAHSERIVAYGRTRRDFRLLPGGAVIGRVIRADDKSPVAGAIVRLRPADPRGQGVLMATASDADGRFQFDTAAPGRHLVTALADQLATVEPTEVVSTIGATPEELVVEVATTRTVSGRVVETGTRTPIAGVTVFLGSRDQRSTSGMPPSHVISQADGSFVFDHVLAGEYVVRAQAGGKVSVTDIKVETADVRDVVVEVDRGASIAGRVLFDGKPVEGAQVSVRQVAMSQTDADGRFTLLRLPAGTHELYAESKRVGAFTRGPSVTVTNAEEKTGVDVSLDLSASISGVVVDQNDAPVSGVFLRFSLLRGQDFGVATTADDGTFTANAMAGGGDYIYEVREREQSPVVFSPVSGKRHPPITVADGRTRVTGVRIKVRIERLAISGRVIDAVGKPVADATVRAYPHEDMWPRMPSAITDERGAFTLGELPAGTYTLLSSTSSGEGHINDVAAGRKGIVLQLAALGGIDGTLEGFTTPPEVKVSSFDHGRQYRAEVTGATFKVRNVASGTYSVTAKPDGSSMLVEVEAGKTNRVTLRALEYGGIAAIVVDGKTRAPMADIRCYSRLKDAGMDAMPSATTSDGSGAFRVDRAPVGDHRIVCDAPRARGFAEAKVSKGQVARLEILMTSKDEPMRGYAGLTLEDQLGEVYVKLVDANGPAARAGIAVGDVVRTVEGERMSRGMRSEAVQSFIESRVDQPLKIGLDRGDKDLEVTLSVEARP